MNNSYWAENYISDEIKKCKALHYRFSRHFARIAVQPVLEVLTSTQKNGVRYYSETWLEDGERKTRYIGREDNSEVKTIKEKHFLKKALQKLDTHMTQLGKASDMIMPFDYNEVNDSLPKVYRLMPEHLKDIAGPTEEEKWYEAALEEKAAIDNKYGISYESDLTHKAKDGTRTRSKSEVAIYNEFLLRGKPCIYEMPAHVGPYLMHPDFTFYSNRYNKVIMWEHAGMLGDPDYMNSFSERTDRYIRAGFVPCVDIIFTFDTMRGDIDTGMIKTLLDEYE